MRISLCSDGEESILAGLSDLGLLSQKFFAKKICVFDTSIGQLRSQPDASGCDCRTVQTKNIWGLTMQINSSATDPAITNIAIQNQIDTAIVSRAKQVEKQQGDAVVQLVEQAAQITKQLASGHIDVKL